MSSTAIGYNKHLALSSNDNSGTCVNSARQQPPPVAKTAMPLTKHFTPEHAPTLFTTLENEQSLSLNLNLNLNFYQCHQQFKNFKTRQKKIWSAYNKRLHEMILHGKSIDMNDPILKKINAIDIYINFYYNLLLRLQQIYGKINFLLSTSTSAYFTASNNSLEKRLNKLEALTQTHYTFKK